MDQTLRNAAEQIVKCAIEAVKPDAGVKRALENVELTGDVYLVAAGKAGWQMAAAAVNFLPRPVKDGVVVTKYDHVKGEIPGIRCF